MSATADCIALSRARCVMITNSAVFLAACLAFLPPLDKGMRDRVVGPDGPVAGALVRIKGGRQHTTSDAMGHFRLPTQAGRLTAWKEGFFIAGGIRAAFRRLRFVYFVFALVLFVMLVMNMTQLVGVI